jgi:hypothetical protein
MQHNHTLINSSNNKLKIHTTHHIRRVYPSRNLRHLSQVSTYHQTRPVPVQCCTTKRVKLLSPKTRLILGEKAFTQHVGLGLKMKRRLSWQASTWSKAPTGVKYSPCLDLLVQCLIYSKIEHRSSSKTKLVISSCSSSRLTQRCHTIFRQLPAN